MGELQPYTLTQAVDAVNTAITESQQRHNLWRGLENLYRTGASEQLRSISQIPQAVQDQLGLELEVVNHVLPHINIILESVAARDPSHRVEAYAGGPDADQGAIVGEKVLRYHWKRQDVTNDVLRPMTQDAVILGSGFCKVGWAFAEEEVERDQQEMIDELSTLVTRDRADAKLSEREPTPVEELAELVSDKAFATLMDDPYVEYVSPYDIFVPESARRIEDARWIAQRILMPMDEVVANDRYNAEAKEALVAADRNATPDKRSGDTDSKLTSPGEDGIDPFTDVEIFEFYDMRTRTLLVFSKESTDVALYEGPLPYEHRYPPFVHMRNFDDGRRFWPFSDMEVAAAIQHELNDLTKEQFASVRRAGNKYAVRKDAITPELIEGIESDESDVVIPVDLEAGENINEVVQSIERKPLPAEVLHGKDDLRLSLREVLGINDFQAGGSGADRMSATAAAVVDGVATLRAAGKKGQVERASARIGLLILLLCQQEMDLERVIRVTGSEDGSAEWLAVTREDLVGEYRVSVEAGSTEAVNPATRKQNALDLISVVIPSLASSGMDPTPMWRIAIRDLGYDPDLVLSQAPPQPGPPAPAGPGGAPAAEPTVPQELLGGPPVPAAVEGDVAI